MLEKWRLRPASTAVTIQPRFMAASPEVSLTDEFPALDWIRREQAWGYKLVRCASLNLVTTTATGRSAEEVDFYVWDQTLLAQETLSPSDLLERVGRHLSLGLTPEEADEVIENRQKAQLATRLAAIRNCADDAERVTAAIGTEALLAGMPGALVEAVEHLAHRGLDGQALGRLAWPYTESAY